MKIRIFRKNLQVDFMTLPVLHGIGGNGQDLAFYFRN
jgi:hypothetical protein